MNKELVKKTHGLSSAEKRMLSQLNFELDNNLSIETRFLNNIPISVLIAHCIQGTDYDEVLYILNSLKEQGK